MRLKLAGHLRLPFAYTAHLPYANSRGLPLCLRRRKIFTSLLHTVVGIIIIIIISNSNKTQYIVQ